MEKVLKQIQGQLLNITLELAIIEKQLERKNKQPIMKVVEPIKPKKLNQLQKQIIGSFYGEPTYQNIRIFINTTPNNKSVFPLVHRAALIKGAIDYLIANGDELTLEQKLLTYL